MSHYTVMSLCGWPQGVSDGDDDDADASSGAARWFKLCKFDDEIRPPRPGEQLRTVRSKG